jgi:hypothetical protein
VEAETTADVVFVNRKGWIRSGPALKCFALYHGPADPSPASRAERPLRSEVHSEGLQPWPRSSNSLLMNTTSTSRSRRPSLRPCPTHHRPFPHFTLQVAFATCRATVGTHPRGRGQAAMPPSRQQRPTHSRHARLDLPTVCSERLGWFHGFVPCARHCRSLAPLRGRAGSRG